MIKLRKSVSYKRDSTGQDSNYNTTSLTNNRFFNRTKALRFLCIKWKMSCSNCHFWNCHRSRQEQSKATSWQRTWRLHQRQLHRRTLTEEYFVNKNSINDTGRGCLLSFSNLTHYRYFNRNHMIMLFSR